ncbi:DMT family transporter [Paenibacillus sp. GP183]|jgi:drug/metabolite transporter (DMT)-like permease|uniref:DMT family transporter n=1 Tax=Paenibacillus sp. GP183 TaxID=1882751 RepID=UPI0008979E16|nr:DMT family transporter [Paenibacillus sp. GP183]SEC66268.1 Permease of the drug/metabolite transporter (DMT) superfamily [Paenibacillus sp. GP183]
MNRETIKKLLPHLGFVLVYILWGINMTSLKIGGKEWDPLVFNGLRFASIIPFLWVYTYFYFRSRSMKLRIAGKDLLKACALGVLTALGMETMLQYALQYSNAANGAVLGRGFMPIITALMALLMGQMRLTWRIALGVPLAFLGVIVIVSAGPSGFHMGADTFRGDALLLLRSLLGALYLIVMNRLMLKYPPILLISLEMTAAALTLLPFVIWKADAAYLSGITHVGWITLAYTAIFASAIGFFVHNLCLASLGPFRASAYGYLLPITAAIAGVWIAGESITLYQCLGGAGVLIAMYLVQRDSLQTIRQSEQTRDNPI